MDAWECSYSICAKRFHSAYFRKIDCIFQVGAYAGIEEEQSEFSKGKAIQLHKKYPFTSENTAVTLIMLKRFNSNPYGGVCMTDSLVFFFFCIAINICYIFAYLYRISVDHYSRLRIVSLLTTPVISEHSRNIVIHEKLSVKFYTIWILAFYRIPN